LDRIRIRKRYLLSIFSLLSVGLLGGCAVLKKTPKHYHYRWVHYSSQIVTIDSTITPDSTISADLAPYREKVDKVMNQKIGRSTGIFLKNRPEGSLGNLVADAVRNAASRIKEKNIDIGVITNSSIKYRLPKGKITRRMIYEIMPYNNKLVILKLTGHQVLMMANEIAKANGEPISGLRMRIDDKKASDILIGRHTLKSNQLYTVATNDYMANGGGDVPALWNPVSRENESISIRQCIEDYINNRLVVHPVLDGRIH